MNVETQAKIVELIVKFWFGELKEDWVPDDEVCRMHGLVRVRLNEKNRELTWLLGCFI